MAKQKTRKHVVARCRDCGATSDEAFLERIKGSKQYICDECASDQAFSETRYKQSYDDSYSDEEEEYDGELSEELY